MTTNQSYAPALHHHGHADWFGRDPSSAPRTVGVSVTRTGSHTARITVTDTSRHTPTVDITTAATGNSDQPDGEEEMEENGRGLLLVTSLAARWGSQRLHGGKRVWAELDTTGKEDSDQ